MAQSHGVDNSKAVVGHQAPKAGAKGNALGGIKKAVEERGSQPMEFGQLPPAVQPYAKQAIASVTKHDDALFTKIPTESGLYYGVTLDGKNGGRNDIYNAQGQHVTGYSYGKDARGMADARWDHRPADVARAKEGVENREFYPVDKLNKLPAKVQGIASAAAQVAGKQGETLDISRHPDVGAKYFRVLADGPNGGRAAIYDAKGNRITGYTYGKDATESQKVWDLELGSSAPSNDKMSAQAQKWLSKKTFGDVDNVPYIVREKDLPSLPSWMRDSMDKLDKMGLHSGAYKIPMGKDVVYGISANNEMNGRDIALYDHQGRVLANGGAGGPKYGVQPIQLVDYSVFF